MTEETSRLSTFFSEAGTIVIVNHTHPDGDAMGSATALARYLSMARGKDVSITVPDAWPVNLDFICKGLDITDFSADPATAQDKLSACDLLVSLDFNSFSRTSGMEPLLRGFHGRKVLIDHHLNPERESFDLCFSKTDISSASELLYEILMDMPDVAGDATLLPEGCGMSLMTGMTTDTNNFANSVFPSTLRMASALLEAGIDRDSVIQHLYNEERENRVRAMGVIFKDKLTIMDGGIAYYIVDAETQSALDLRDGEMEGFVNIPLTIKNVRISISLKEVADGFRVSIRSKRGVSANRLAKGWFNGGGHELAAGGRLRIPEDIADRSQAADYIMQSTARFLQEEGLDKI